jgi:hypothetical protein
MKEESEVNTDNKEEFDAYRKEIFDRLNAVLDAGNPFMILAEGEDAAIVTIGGGAQKVVKMIATAMNHSDEVRMTIEAACKIHELADRAADAITGRSRGKEIKVDKDSKINIIEELECENCDNKDDCEIYKLGNQTLDRAGMSKLLNELHKRHPEMVQMMAKGGDA